MQVLKIQARGLTTSFRYPHFMMGVQPTYDMPPPATLYGHIASALGRWFDPAEARFAVRFTYRRKLEDVETTILLKPGRGKLPGNKTMPKALEGNPNPFRREILFFPHLTLYIDRPDWLEAFQHPRYPVVLGRSQDLFTYTRVEIITLQPTQEAYLENTLLPYAFARRTAAGRVVIMPRWLDVRNNRRPTFEQYVILRGRVHTRQFLRFGQEPDPELWADPTEPEIQGDPMGLVFHRWSS